jgi:hypothetical protein
MIAVTRLLQIIRAVSRSLAAEIRKVVDPRSSIFTRSMETPSTSGYLFKFVDDVLTKLVRADSPSPRTDGWGDVVGEGPKNRQDRAR